MWISYQCLTDGPQGTTNHLLKLIPFCEDSFLKVAGEQEDWSVAMESGAPWKILGVGFLTSQAIRKYHDDRCVEVISNFKICFSW